MGSWNERLPHFRFDATPSHGDEIQAEYFVARRDGAAAIRAVHALGADIGPHLHTSELRSVAADSLWLSPTQEQASIAIHFTFKNHPRAVTRLLPEIEAALAPFNPRPHWGKWFAMGSHEVREKYPRVDDFLDLAERFDPDHRFHNDYLARVLGRPGAPEGR